LKKNSPSADLVASALRIFIEDQMVEYAVLLAQEATDPLIDKRLNEVGPTSVAGTPGKPIFSKKEQQALRSEVAERTQSMLRTEVQQLFDDAYEELGRVLTIPGTVMIPEVGDTEAEHTVGKLARDLFIQFDADGDGDLSRSELEHLVVRLGKCLSKQELSAAMVSMDTDGNGRIAIDEFEEWWSHTGIQMLVDVSTATKAEQKRLKRETKLAEKRAKKRAKQAKKVGKTHVSVALETDNPVFESESDDDPASSGRLTATPVVDEEGSV
jgi:hypothetical protein